MIWICITPAMTMAEASINMKCYRVRDARSVEINFGIVAPGEVEDILALTRPKGWFRSTLLFVAVGCWGALLANVFWPVAVQGRVDLLWIVLGLCFLLFSMYLICRDGRLPLLYGIQWSPRGMEVHFLGNSLRLGPGDRFCVVSVGDLALVPAKRFVYPIRGRILRSVAVVEAVP